MAHRQAFSFANPAILKLERKRKWIAILTIASAAGIIFMEVLYPEILAAVFKFAEAIVLAIWDMLSGFAAACGQFIRWVFQPK